MTANDQPARSSDIMAPSRQGTRKSASSGSGRVREADRDEVSDDATASSPPASAAPARNGSTSSNGSPPANGSPADNGAPAGNGKRDTDEKGRKEPMGDASAEATVASAAPALPADGIGPSRGPKVKDPSPQAKPDAAAKPGTAPASGSPAKPGTGSARAANGAPGPGPVSPPSPARSYSTGGSRSAGSSPVTPNPLPSRPKPSPLLNPAPDSAAPAVPERPAPNRPASDRATLDRATPNRPIPGGTASEPALSPAAFAWEMPDPPPDSPSSPARTFLRNGPAAASPAAGSTTATRPAPEPAKTSTTRPAATVQPAPPKQDKPQKAKKADARSARQAHLTIARLEPWSVMKFSFVVSLVAFVILFVAVSILYGTLSTLGVFDSLQRVVSSVTSSQGSAGVNAKVWFSASKVLGYTALLGSLNIVLITAMSTIGAVIYNLTSRLVGGVEVTLRETE